MARSDQYLTPLIAVTTSLACVVVLGVILFADQLVAGRAGETANATTAAGRPSSMVDRARKSDQLPLPAQAGTRTPIATVEIVGVRNAAIVYHDRSGNVLFRTDPVANVTVVAKNVELPELTMRETASSEVVRMSLEAKRSKPLSGCESAFARPSPEILTDRADRCLAERQFSATQMRADLH